MCGCYVVGSESSETGEREGREVMVGEEAKVLEHKTAEIFGTNENFSCLL